MVSDSSPLLGSGTLTCMGTATATATAISKFSSCLTTATEENSTLTQPTPAVTTTTTTTSGTTAREKIIGLESKIFLIVTHHQFGVLFQRED